MRQDLGEKTDPRSKHPKNEVEWQPQAGRRQENPVAPAKGEGFLQEEDGLEVAMGARLPTFSLWETKQHPMGVFGEAVSSGKPV